jgi:hypothetical protein
MTVSKQSQDGTAQFAIVVFGTVVWLHMQPHHRTNYNDVF